MICAPHGLDNLLGFCLRNAATFSKNLDKSCINLAGHVVGIAASVEVGLLVEKLVDLSRIFFQTMLNIHLFGGLSGESRDHLKFVAQGLLMLL